MATTETLLVVGVALVVIYVTCALWFMVQRKASNLPPGPAALPLIGSLHLLGTHPHQSLAALARTYGPVMSVQLGQKMCIVATSPDVAKELLKLQDANFCSRPRVRAAQLLMPNDIVFNEHTPVFRQLRKVMQSELTSAKRQQASKHIRTEEAAFMLQSISQEGSGGASIRLKTYLNVMAVNTLARMVLNKRLMSTRDESEVDDEVREFRGIIEEMLDCFAAIHPKDFFSIIPQWADPMGLDAKFRRQRARMDAFYTKVMAHHREYRKKNPVSADDEKAMLDVLQEQVAAKQPFGVTEEHAKGVVWDVFAAGTDTSVLTSEWAMAEILRSPAVMKKAQAELDQVVGKTRMLQESDIPHLKYLQAIVKEALRMHAPVPMLPHQSISASKVMGYDIPARTRVFINIWGISRDPRNWENPLEFRPERFLTSGGESHREYHGHQFEFLPFGSGRRLCPGISFGSGAVSMQVGSLLHAFDWSLPGGLRLEDLDMTEGRSFTIAKDKPLIVIATPRLPLHLYHCTLTTDN